MVSGRLVDPQRLSPKAALYHGSRCPAPLSPSRVPVSEIDRKAVVCESAVSEHVAMIARHLDADDRRAAGLTVDANELSRATRRTSEFSVQLRLCF